MIVRLAGLLLAATSLPVAAQDGSTPAPAATGTTASVPPASPAAAGTVVDRIAGDPTLSKLAAALNGAGLDAKLAEPGPFTVFAPTDNAFGRLASGTLTTLMKPANKASLAKLLSYHVVAGRMSFADLRAKAEAGGGTAMLDTLAGQTLTVAFADGAMSLTDAGGNKSYVKTPDLAAGNGVVHIVNGVAVPKLR